MVHLIGRTGLHETDVGFNVLCDDGDVVFCRLASTPMLVSQWSNPAYESPFFKRIAVSCVDGHLSIRRTVKMSLSRNSEPQALMRCQAIGVFPRMRNSMKRKCNKWRKRRARMARSLFGQSALKRRQKSAPPTFLHPGSVFSDGMFPLHGTVGTARREFIGIRSIRLKRLLAISSGIKSFGAVLSKQPRPTMSVRQLRLMWETSSRR